MSENHRRIYQACSRCTAKWFIDESLHDCPRCGADTMPAVSALDLPIASLPAVCSVAELSDPLANAAAFLSRVPAARRRSVLLSALRGLPPFNTIEARHLCQLLAGYISKTNAPDSSGMLPMALQPPLRHTTTSILQRAADHPSPDALRGFIEHLRKRCRNARLRVVDGAYRATLQILRHTARRHQLRVESDGWTAAEGLLNVINGRSLELELWRDWHRGDLQKQQDLRSGERIRFDAVSDRVRACYGHSLPNICAGALRRPPLLLFHGTSQHQSESILREGLVPTGRVLVHLTDDFDYAVHIAGKHTGPTVLAIEAEESSASGVTFWHCNSHVWQCECVPVAFIHQIALD